MAHKPRTDFKTGETIKSIKRFPSDPYLEQDCELPEDAIDARFTGDWGFCQGETIKRIWTSSKQVMIEFEPGGRGILTIRKTLSGYHGGY